MYPKINNENILPFRCDYRFSLVTLLSPFITLFRLAGLCIIFAFVKSPIVQLGCSILLNFAVLLYFIRMRPYNFSFKNFRIKNYIAIYHEACLLLFEFLMLILVILQT